MNYTALKSSVSDVLLLSSPLVICLVVFAVFGDNIENFLSIPEWSFLSTFLLIETLKESQSRTRNTGEELINGRSAICTYFVLILTGATVMVLAFAYSRGYLSLSIMPKYFSFVQPILLATAVVLSLKVKYETRVIEINSSHIV